jgi:hypothetical protein
VNEFVVPEVVTGVLDQFDERNEQAFGKMEKTIMKKRRLDPT